MMSGRWLRIAAGGELVAVADDVVLEGQDAEDRFLVLRVSARNARSMFGIENGLWEKSMRFSSSFHSYIGKSTIQQNANWSFSARPSSSPMRTRALPASAAAFSGRRRREEHRVARLEPAFSRDRRLHRGGDELGDRPLAGERAALLLEHDVAEARRALGARPLVELVEERARLRSGAGRGDGAHHAAGRSRS